MTTNAGAEHTDRSMLGKIWHVRAELLWGLAALVVLFSTVNPVLLIGIALAIATVAVAWMGFHELLDRAQREDAEPAATTPRPAAAIRPEPQNSTAQTPWQSHNAA